MTWKILHVEILNQIKRFFNRTFSMFNFSMFILYSFGMHCEIYLWHRFFLIMYFMKHQNVLHCKRQNRRKSVHQINLSACQPWLGSSLEVHQINPLHYRINPQESEKGVHDSSQRINLLYLKIDTPFRKTYFSILIRKCFVS